MRRVLGILLVIIGLALLAGARILGDQPASSLSVTIGGYILGVVLIAFGGRIASGASIAGAARNAARTAVLRLVAVVVVIAFLLGLVYVFVINGSPETKDAVLSAIFNCRMQSHTFSPTGVGFSVYLPGTENPVDQVDTSSPSTPVHEFKQNCGLSNYYIVYVDLPTGSVDSAGASAALQGVLTALAKDNKMISQNAVTLGSSPGVQFVMEEPTTTIFSKTAIDYGAVYLVNNRFYTIYVSSPTSVDSPTQDAAFLQSFKVNS